ISGTIGNCTILFSYVNLSVSSTSTIFIIFLAGVDLWTCAIVTPCIAIMEYNDFDTNTLLCRFYIFSKIIIIISSLIITAIAFDRLFIIINYTRWTPRLVKTILILITLVALIFGSIITLSFSSQPWSESITMVKTNFSTYFLNLTENYSRCYADTTVISDDIREILKHISNKLFFVCIGLVAVLYTITYILALRRHTTRLKAIKKCINVLDRYDRGSLSTSCSQQLLHSELLLLKEQNTSNNKLQQKKNVSFKIDKQCAKSTTVSLLDADELFSSVRSFQQVHVTFPLTSNARNKNLISIDNNPPTSRNSKVLKRQLHKHRLKLFRITSTFLIITLSFILFYLPSVLNAEQIISSPLLIYYSYLCTHAINPIIYCFMNKTLRVYVFSTLKCIK
ncbi:unnamed protein product, partial [Didymodactylos carnosus]